MALHLHFSTYASRTHRQAFEASFYRKNLIGKDHHKDDHRHGSSGDDVWLPRAQWFHRQ
ncbi:hypothetical protein NOVOSPHI9U_350049 [Novosphingobium sp. 9U]|nr:hypothetical protein NOVOSPHI9U_350049 [Novosphingobium sp. 9U]